MLHRRKEMRPGLNLWRSLGNWILLLGSLMLLYPPGTAGADGKATPEKRTDDWKKVFHIGTINVSADSAHEEFSFTPTETLIDIDKIAPPGPVQNISQIVTRLPIFDGRGSSDLVPSDDSIYMRGFSGSRFTTAIDGMPLRKTGGHQSTNIVDYGELPQGCLPGTVQGY